MPLTPATDGAPCEPWLDAEDLPEDCVADVDPLIVEGALMASTTLLWAFSGRRFGPSCPITIRPGTTDCAPPPRRPGSRAPDPRELVIAGPLYSVDEVLIDGVEQVEDVDYIVLDHRIIRLLNDVRWPRRNDLDLATTEVGTSSVTYTVGLAIPEDGLYANQVLACELINARKGGPCRLPKKTRTVSRQGVTIDLNNLAEYLVDGRMGIDEVDAFIVAQNPHALPSRSTVMSPDTMPPRRVS